MLSVFLFILALALLGRWIYGWAGSGPTLAPHYEAEVARLRGEVDELNAQVSRLTEEQQFMMKLLGSGENRPAPELPPDPRNEETV